MIWIRLNAAKPTTRQKGRSIQRIFSWVLALLCLVAAALMLLHLKPKESIPAYVFRSPNTGSCAAASPMVQHQPLEGAVNVNTAGVDELTTIPGVGPTLAQAIIEERITHGFFYYPEDLLCVKGIGEKTLVKLLPYVTLE
ncbi:MAG: helix-hairpin-helix domain-containing protein [Clostridia bacterium]|nr:helix-hairpin-helix domain-containing protein [Clostridia bacterium]